VIQAFVLEVRRDGIVGKNVNFEVFCQDDNLRIFVKMCFISLATT
jgi:hypothetical protein